MIMKTKHVKNTGPGGGKLENRLGGAKGENCQGGKGSKKLHRGHFPFCPIPIYVVRPCLRLLLGLLMINPNFKIVVQKALRG